MAPQGLVHATPAENVALASANGSEHLHVLQHVAGPVFFNVVDSNCSGFTANVCCLILFCASSVELGVEGRGGVGVGGAGVLSLHCNCQLANQPFMETRRLIVVRWRGFRCELRCVSLVSLNVRINSRPLIKNARTPGGLGVGAAGVKPGKQGWEQGIDM